MKTTLLIPTKNEIEGLRVIMPRIKREWVDEILFVDAGSTDGTLEYIKENNYQYIIQKTPGVFAAWWEGFEAASGDAIILFSPDGNSVPEVIPQLVAKMKEGDYDIVIASRYIKGAKNEDDNQITALGNRFFTGLINLLFRGKYTDALGMYKIFKKELLLKLGLYKHKDEIFEILIAVRAAKRKLKVAEIPGDEPKRIGEEAGASRAWPGFFGKIRGGWSMFSCIIKEFFFWR
jgi:glycosyltransferase involved in cell wall biosynthesis